MSYTPKEIKKWMVVNQKRNVYSDYFDLAIDCASALGLFDHEQNVPPDIVYLAKEAFK